MNATGDILQVGIRRGGETYAVLYRDSPRQTLKALKVVCDWACNPELSFTWSDQALIRDAMYGMTPPDEMRQAAPDLLPLNCAATFQWWAATLKAQTSPRDNVKRWRQVLRGLEAVPHYGLTQPIRVAPNAAKRVCSREHIYTGISRAKQCCVLIGKLSVAHGFTRRTAIDKRKTFLAHRIKEGMRAI